MLAVGVYRVGIALDVQPSNQRRAGCKLATDPSEFVHLARGDAVLLLYLLLEAEELGLECVLFSLKLFE